MAQMTTKFLEHSSLAPARFSALINDPKRDAARGILPLSTRILQANLTTEHEAAEEFNRVFLVPDGRFLITQSTDAIHIWDIGTHALDIMKPRPIASRVKPLNTVFDCVPSKHDFLVFIGVTHPMVPTYYSEISVHRVGVTHTTPDFEEIGVYKKKDMAPIVMDAFSCSKDMFVFLQGNSVIYWDFYANKAAVDTHLMTKHSAVQQIGGNEVLIFDDCGFSLFDIPCLDEIKDGAITPVAATPVMDFAHPPPRPYSQFIVPSPAWLPERYNRGYFGLLGYCSTGATVHDLYTICKMDHTDTLGKIPVIRASYCLGSNICSAHYDDRHTATFQIRMCDNFTTLAWYRDNPVDQEDMMGIIISTTAISDQPIAKGGNLSPDGSIRRLWEPVATPNIECQGFSLCPASGRLCILTQENEIRVLDYLAPF
ncbi:hypothetical protein DXG01_013882 [Tephrocybe rancida]|nr:hypothetical protein DXG01_013882 [Tephrocybe rancida]